METFELLKQQLASAERDAQKFFLQGNKAAGTRLRIALQKSKVLAQEVRKSVLVVKNSRNERLKPKV